MSKGSRNRTPDIGDIKHHTTEYLPGPDYAEQLRESPSGSEDWLALKLAELHQHELRHDARLGWLRWEGGRWQTDQNAEVLDLVRAICRENAKGGGSNDASRARKTASASTVSGVERLARTDRRLAARSDQWDQDTWVLNTPGGLVDLRTGAMRPCDPFAYCTKQTAVAPARPGSIAPRWMSFLHEIACGDAELVSFIRRMAGYSLTGDTSEHALFFAFGIGGNGKSKLIEALSKVLGGYAITAPADVFLASKSDRHPTELADLRGARLVVSSEIDEGRRWNEARIKSLTGGDKIKARLMRQDFFEFEPTFKLLIIANNKPSLRGVDDAIRRRLHMLPFLAKFEGDARDTDLSAKLRSEWPEILRWAIDGCLEWQRAGLVPPNAVIDATDSYLAAEDSFSLWFDESCALDPVGWAQSSELFASWKGWAERAGEPVGSLKRFVQTLETRPLDPKPTPKRDGQGRRGFLGLRLNRWQTDGT